MEPTANDLFAALGDPTRRAIFQRLSHEGEQTVGRLTAHAGVSQPAVSSMWPSCDRPGWWKGALMDETYYRVRSEGSRP